MNLVDFLPSFIETPLWDIAKIFQDLNYGWSYRDINGPEKASVKVLFDSCIPSQIKLFKKFWHDQLLLINALNLARIIPYIKDKPTHQWLYHNLKSAMKSIP